MELKLNTSTECQVVKYCPQNNRKSVHQMINRSRLLFTDRWEANKSLAFQETNKSKQMKTSSKNHTQMTHVYFRNIAAAAAADS